MLLAPVGCRSPSKVQGTELAGTEGASLPVVTSDAEGMTLIAKTLLGIDPISRDGRMNLVGPSRGGLIRIAELLGYELYDNDCGAVWKVNIDRSSSPNDIVLSLQAPHSGVDVSGASSPLCNNKYLNQPVTYTFSNWQGTATVIPTPYTSTAEDKTGLVNLGASSGTSPSGAVTAGTVVKTLNSDGTLVINAPESVVAQADPAGSAAVSQTIGVTYSRTVVTGHSTSISNSSNTAVGNSLTLGFSETGSYSDMGITGSINFTQNIAKSSTTTTARSMDRGTTNSKATTLTCTNSIVQPPGCYFKVTLTANYQQTKAKVLANVTLAPRTISFSGGLLGIKNTGTSTPMRELRRSRLCMYKPDTCHGQDVTAAFGGPNEPFAVQINDAVTHGGDPSWSWEKLRGDDKIDPVLSYVQEQNYGSFSLQGTDASEAITSCTIKVDVLPRSDATCAAPAPATIATTAKP